MSSAASAVTSAVGGLTGALGGGGGPPQPGRSSSQIDAQTRKIRDKGFDLASKVADQKYQRYGGDRFANQSADTQASFDAIRGIQGQGQQALTQAQQTGQDISGYTPDQVKQQSFLQGPSVQDYMSPQVSTVMDSMQKRGMENIQKSVNQLRGSHNQAFGGSFADRAALETGTTIAEGNKAITDAQTQYLDKAFSDAAARKQSDQTMDQQRQLAQQQAGLQAQDVRLRGAQQQMAGTQAGRQAGLEDARMLSQIGAQQEGYDQRQKDYDYDQWQEERDWDKNNAMFLSNISGAAPHGTSSVTHQPGGQSKKGGLGGALMGGAMGFLQSGGNPYAAGLGALGGLS